MVLSLAFILAFIGSAVALLIGILIFSEVQDSMLATFDAPILIANGTAGGTITTTTMYGCESPSTGGNIISVLDKATGSIISSNTLSITGAGFGGSGGCTGLTQDPISKTWYIITRESGGDGGDGWLATVDPTTGIGTAIGQVDIGLQTIAFDSAGNLFGYSNNNDSDEFFGIDTTTALLTSDRCDNDFGFAHPSALAYNFNNNKMYLLTDQAQATGGQLNTMRIFNDNTFASSNCDKTDVAIDISDASWVASSCDNLALQDCAEDPQSMTFSTEDNLFYAFSKATEYPFFSITPNAPFTAILITDLSPQSNMARGLGFVLSTGVGSPPIFESQVPDSFNQASNIAFTVIAILPVALFFVLFSIFGGRTE